MRRRIYMGCTRHFDWTVLNMGNAVFEKVKRLQQMLGDVLSLCCSFLGPLVQLFIICRILPHKLHTCDLYCLCAQGPSYH